jgi:hypothetical protein
MLMILLYYSDKTITFDGTFTMYSRKADIIYSVLYIGHISDIAPRAKNCKVKVMKKVELITDFA